jgi:uncharacterized protein (TIGR00251 family)
MKAEYDLSNLQSRRNLYASKLKQPVVLQVKVKPNARVSKLEQAENGTWLAQLKAVPVDGKANEELIALISKHFDCRKSAVTIKSGASGRMKLVRVD